MNKLIPAALFVVGLTLWAVFNASIKPDHTKERLNKNPDASVASTKKEAGIERQTALSASNLSYRVWYVGENSARKTRDVLDILEAINFPPQILEHAVFIVLDSMPSDRVLFEAGDVEILVDFNLRPKDEAGFYTVTTSGIEAVFVSSLSDQESNKGYFISTVLHELGHLLGESMGNEDRLSYYSLRSISEETPWNGLTWKDSPQEDFAETFKNIYSKHIEDMPYHQTIVRTSYGTLVPIKVELLCSSTYDPLKEQAPESGIDRDPELQACRRKFHILSEVFGAQYKDLKESELRVFFDSLLEGFRSL